MKHISLLILLAIATSLPAQTPFSLDEALEIARQQSLDAFKAQNTFLAEYWSYQSYRSRQKPHLTWHLSPVTYNRKMTLRYDYENDVEIYRQQQTLSSYTSLNLSQNIVATGGTVYVESDLYRLQNLGTEVNSWTSTPVQIGLQQPLFGFNALKWEKKISPLEYENSKKEFLQSVQETNLTAVNLYFSYLLAQVKRDISAQNVAAADTLYRIGEQRFDIASIQHEELLDLELSKFNSDIELSKAEKALQKALFSLRSFLGLRDDENIIPQIPPILNHLQIDIPTAVEFAKMYNPGMMRLKTQQLEAQRDLDYAIKNARFSANLNASYGLNQAAANLNGTYQSPLDQQMVSMSMSVPLLDWGDRKGQKQMAQSRKEITEIEIKQALIDFEQQVNLKVLDFNLQARVVQSAAKADTLAQKSYELTKKRFILGKADVLRLTTSMAAMQNARESYLQSLATWWQYFYEVQSMCLYDFVDEVSLSADFDAMIKQ
ncbi:MAG: TolC family protein [Prolixibacteraceae bacterium]|jgi:outer membrane protein TolC|nr:TolC family protein [Prolixibacteraceae bacterium]